MHKISHISIEEQGAHILEDYIVKEREVAMRDLIEDNHFVVIKEGETPNTTKGPYRLTLTRKDRRIIFNLSHEDETPAGEFHLSLSPFRQVVKDYFQICQSYFDAVKTLPPSQIETIDMARRGIHNEGASVLQERLENKAELDTDTARRLFTLICVMHLGAQI